MSFSYKELVELIMEVLECDNSSLLEHNNLIEAGLTSLATMQIVNRLREQGIKVSFSELMLSAYIKDWWNLISLNSKKNNIEKLDF